MSKRAKTIKIRREDVIWGYLAQFFSIASGVILLPLVLKMLSAEEVGMNYLMLSVGQLVVLVDFGFSPQFSRNITYVYSGAQRLLRKGIEKNDSSNNVVINYRLLSTLIGTARWLYRVLAGIVLLLMLTMGSIYIYYVTKGFTNIQNSFLVWVIFSFGVFFQIYYSYYSSLLTGSGKIMESKKAMIYTSVLKILLTYALLYGGLGLLGIVIANSISPFLTRYLSYKYYFTSELKGNISPYKIELKEKLSLFKTLWYNSKKMGIATVSGYLTYGASTLMAGIYLSLSDVASYGLMIQLVSLIGGISGILFVIYQPRFASLQMSNNVKALQKESAYTMCMFYGLFIIGTFCLILIVPSILHLLGSQTVLPSMGILLACTLFRLLDNNFWNLCQIVIAGNEFPFLKSCFYTALGIVVGTYISLAWLHWGIWGIVIATGFVQTVWNNWYWPHYVMKEINMTGSSFVATGCQEFILRVTNVKKLCIK